jgi:hypothetical protein
MKLLNFLNNNIILEVSEKLKNQLYDKFKSETEDDREQIISNIDLFDRYKGGLSPEKRDISRYSYNDLKSVVDNKQYNKTIEDIFTGFKKKEGNLENASLRKYIKKFLEIQSELPPQKQDISNYKFLDLVSLIDKNYSKLLSNKMLKKFRVENPQLNRDQLLFYINSYDENFDLIPINVKGIDKMSFDELEHLLDGLEGKKDVASKNDQDVDNIDLKYDENGLKIFAPITKDQCIRLRNGRGWCTSREGGGNMYYNYRLGSERTLYYVIDEDKSFDDTNFAVVILVDPNGQKAMADKSNSGKFGGSTNMPWSEIVSKVPKLKGLEHLFVSNPLTKEEKTLINTVKDVRVGDNPMESFKSPQEVEMWLEYVTPTLRTIQYSNLIPELKKKYIALGMELTPEMINSSESEVIKYYISKKITSIKDKDLNSLTTNDIALLNTSTLKQLKEELKPKYSKGLLHNGNTLTINGFTGGAINKFISLYGLDDLFQNLPETLTDIHIINDSTTNNIIITIPDSINKFKNLDGIQFDNCINHIPETICGLSKLTYVSIVNNNGLTSIPECMGLMTSIVFINLSNNENLVIPKSISENGLLLGDNIWDLNN